MTIVVQNLPTTFRSGERLLSSGASQQMPVIAAVQKFNAAFPMFAIQTPDRAALAVMKKYASLMGHTDLAAELEYHLSKPMDCDLSVKVRL